MQKIQMQGTAQIHRYRLTDTDMYLYRYTWSAPIARWLSSVAI